VQLVYKTPNAAMAPASLSSATRKQLAELKLADAMSLLMSSGVFSEQEFGQAHVQALAQARPITKSARLRDWSANNQKSSSLRP
jgi:hypothetical protein